MKINVMLRIFNKIDQILIKSIKFYCYAYDMSSRLHQNQYNRIKFGNNPKKI